MGTNYYLEERSPCPTCGRDYEKLHIGKSSSGWCFGLHVIPEEGLNSLDDWKARWDAGGRIVDEYGVEQSTTEMLEIITDRSSEKPEGAPYGYSSWVEMYRRNHARPGPNNLLRHEIGPHCIGHGAGTWDLIPGEFS